MPAQSALLQLEEPLREKAAEIVRVALRTIDSYNQEGHFLERAEAAVAYHRQHCDRLQQEREELTRQIRELGYHDIGHARGELQKKHE